VCGFLDLDSGLSVVSLLKAFNAFLLTMTVCLSFL
jgi:hypothetical protein